MKDEGFRKYKPCHPVRLLVGRICVIPRTSRPPRGAPKRYYTSVVQNVKCIKAIRVWPGDGRFFTSRTRSRFPLMLRLPAPGGSHFSTVLCFTRLPSPSEPPRHPRKLRRLARSPALRDRALFLHSGDTFFYISHFTNFSDEVGVRTKTDIGLDPPIVFGSFF